MSGDWNNIINSGVFIAYKTNYSFNLLTAWLANLHKYLN